MGAPPSTYLDGLFQATACQDGVEAGAASQFNYASPLTAAYNGTTKRVDIGVNSSLVVSTAAVAAALAATSSIVLANGAYYTGTTATTDASPFAALAFQLLSGQVAIIRATLQGITATPKYAKFVREWAVTNDAGSISVFDVATVGADVDRIGLAASIGILIVGGNVCAFGANGKAATNITWGASALVQVL